MLSRVGGGGNMDQSGGGGGNMEQSGGGMWSRVGG